MSLQRKFKMYESLKNPHQVKKATLLGYFVFLVSFFHCYVPTNPKKYKKFKNPEYSEEEKTRWCQDYNFFYDLPSWGKDLVR